MNERRQATQTHVAGPGMTPGGRLIDARNSVKNRKESPWTSKRARRLSVEALAHAWQWEWDALDAAAS
jgi:hypothetical protein